MSEFKFACPICGQHITCDSGSSGTPMDCPTCFRKLVVPQAPAAGSPNFVLTASAAQTRKIPLPGNIGPMTTTAPARKLPLLAIALGLFVCAVGAGLFIFKQKVFNSNKSGGGGSTTVPGREEQKPIVPLVLLPPSTNWTLNLAEANTPESPATGMVNGRAFTFEKATIQGGRLDLRQGPKWPPDVGLSIHLFAERAQDLAGKTVTLEATRTNAPRVILRWKDERNEPVTKEFRQGYAARLEFGQVTGNRLDGKIYLATPDEAKSYVAGTFTAEIRKPTPPKK